MSDHLVKIGAAVRARTVPWLIVVGMAGGVLGVLFVRAISVLQDVIGPGHVAPLPQVLVLAAVGGVVGFLAYRWGTTGGVNVLVDNIHVLGGSKSRKGLFTLVPSAILGIAAGSALGPEAPLVETAGATGTEVAERIGWSPPQVRVLTLTGMAAGLSVLFGAPIGGAVFALEILHRDGLEYYEALVPSLIGSLCGLVVFEVATGHGLFAPLWTVPNADPATLGSVVPVLLVAVLGAAASAAFVLLTRGVRTLARRLPVWARPMVGGIGLGLLAWWSPYALTYGEGQLQDIVSLNLALGALVVAAVAKLLASSLCAGTEWKGGFIIPLFFVGAAVGQALHVVMPGTDVALLTTCGMVAACVGATKTPLGSTLVVAGTTGFALVPMLLLASLVSFLLTRPLVHFSSQRSRAEDDADDMGGPAGTLDAAAA